MKKWMRLLCMMLTLSIFGIVPALATDEEQPQLIMAQEIPETRQLPRLVDHADLLTESEEMLLLVRLDSVSEEQQCDVAAVTVTDLEGKTIEAYADDFYDYNGYGMGDGRDGILFLIKVGDDGNEAAFTTHGFGITAFTDYGQDMMWDELLPELKEHEFYDAIEEYYELSDKLLTMANEGKPYDVDSNKKQLTPSEKIIKWGVIYVLCFLIALLPAWIVVLVMKSGMKTVRHQKSAQNYLYGDGFQVTNRQDIFVKTHTITHRIEDDDHDSGGSSTHTSSSGSTHGGSSRSF